jgi:hypothetical protein
VRTVVGIALALLVGAVVGACSASTEEFFADGFESGDLLEWDHSQAISGRIVVVDDDVAQGERAGRFEVRDGDEEPDTGAQRAEVVSGLKFGEGDVRYFRILAQIESWDDDHWGLIWQIHDDSDNSPPLSLQEVGGAKRVLWLGPGDDSDAYWETELPKDDEWFEIVIRVEFGESGSVRVWLDGEEEEMANGETVLREVDTLGEPAAYDKLGVYRSSSAEEVAVVFFDGYRVTDELVSDPPR